MNPVGFFILFTQKSMNRVSDYLEPITCLLERFSIDCHVIALVLRLLCFLIGRCKLTTLSANPEQKQNQNNASNNVEMAFVRTADIFLLQSKTNCELIWLLVGLKFLSVGLKL